MSTDQGSKSWCHRFKYKLISYKCLRFVITQYRVVLIALPPDRALGVTMTALLLPDEWQGAWPVRPPPSNPKFLHVDRLLIHFTLVRLLPSEPIANSDVSLLLDYNGNHTPRESL